MTQGAHRGYTILETMLFIAISTLLLFYTIGTFNARVNEVRYFDNVSQVESFFQKQLSEVASGIRMTDATPCVGGVAATNCVTLGRLITVMETDPILLQVEEVLGVDAAGVSDDNEQEALAAFQPRTYGVSEYRGPAGLVLGHDAFRHRDALDRKSVFILRSPKTGAIQHYAYGEKPGDTNALARAGTLNEPVNVCLRDDNSTRLSFISIGPYSALNEKVNDAGYFSLTRDATDGIPNQGGCT